MVIVAGAGLAPRAAPPAETPVKSQIGGQPAPPMTPAQPPDLAVLVREAQRTQVADTAAWARYRFRRRSQRYQLDADGNASPIDDLEYVITPKGSSFDETLVRMNGGPPPPDEVERQRRMAPFSKRYWAMLQGTGESESGGYSMADLLRMASYRYGGLEMAGGIPCYRLDFSPGDDDGVGGLKGKFGRAMAGSLWVSAEGYHLVRARARTIKPISIALSLSKLHNVEVSLDAGPVGGDVYLPSRVEMTAEARVLIVPYRRRNLYEYWDFTREAALPPPGSVPP